MNLESLEKSINKCVLCKNILSLYKIKPKPIFSSVKNQRIMLIGQAPGITEYKTGKAFSGDTGKSIKNLFKECGIEKFDEVVYQTSIMKCFPGRKENMSVDRKPSQLEVKNCISFLENQIEIINPDIILCLGMLSWSTLIKLKEKDENGFIENTYGKKASQLLTKDIINKRFKYKESNIISMIHPSGAANGARSKNKLEHEESIKLLKNEIKILCKNYTIN